MVGGVEFFKQELRMVSTQTYFKGEHGEYASITVVARVDTQKMGSQSFAVQVGNATLAFQWLDKKFGNGAWDMAAETSLRNHTCELQGI